MRRYATLNFIRGSAANVLRPTNMHNELTDLLGINVPVIGAPMAKASEADLSAAVAKAGGMGFIGAGYMDSATLSRVYKQAVQQLSGKDKAHSAVGIGLQNYSCSKVSVSGCKWTENASNSKQ